MTDGEAKKPMPTLGGIVTGPMRDHVGDPGPDVIIPLEGLRRMLGASGAPIVVELDGATLKRALEEDA